MLRRGPGPSTLTAAAAAESAADALHAASLGGSGASRHLPGPGAPVPERHHAGESSTVPRTVPARRPIAALLAAAIALWMPGAVAAAPPSADDLASWRPVGSIHTRTTLPEATPGADGGRAPPVVFVLPDEMWDTRRAWPYLDQLSLLGVTVVELWPEQDQRLGLAEARDAIASATDEFGLDPTRVALLGFGTGGRLALALAAPDRPAAALYPTCQGAPPPDRGARVMVLHPDEASEARACAALTAGRPGARSGRPSAGAGHGWDVIGEQTDGRLLLPHPDDPNTLSRRLPAHTDNWATFRAVRAVSSFLLGTPSAVTPVRAAP